MLDHNTRPPTARAYLEGLSLEHRRRLGQVYTPAHLADFVLELAGYPGNDHETTLLDPACGGGAFLVGALHRLSAARPRPRTRGQKKALYDLVARRFWGIDLDPEGCRLALQAVLETLAEITREAPPEGLIDNNIVCADFLVSDEAEALLERAGPIDLIVGNPPYVAATRLGAAYKDTLKQRFASSFGRLDLYTAFFERALRSVPSGARVVLITPDKYLLSRSARPLRSFILEHAAVRTVARFNSHKVFEKAATVPCVTVLERSGEIGNIDVLQCTDTAIDGQSSMPAVDISSRATVAQHSLSSAAWQLATADEGHLSRRLQARHPRLSQLMQRVSAGPATGRDGVYVLPQAHTEVESELLVPVIRGRDINAFELRDPALSLLLPYVNDRLGAPSLIDLAHYPKAAAYLERNRAELSDRHCVRNWGKPWYDLHDAVRRELATMPKILVPDIADSNRFAVDEGRFVPLHSAYYLLPRGKVDLHYIVGVLNSKVMTFLIRLSSPVVKDGFNRYRQQFLLDLPIPMAPPPIREAIARAARYGNREALEPLVAELFSLTSADRRQIDEVLARKEPV